MHDRLSCTSATGDESMLIDTTVLIVQELWVLKQKLDEQEQRLSTQSAVPETSQEAAGKEEDMAS